MTNIEGKTPQSNEINLNAARLELVEQLIADPEKYWVLVERASCGATLIDLSIQASGGFLAGEIVSKICLGGYASVQIVPMQYEDTILPSAFVYTDYPVQSTLASQYTDWNITVGNFSAIASGPARALALESPELFKKIAFKEKLDKAVLALETETRPTEETIAYIAKKCNVEPSNLYLLMYSTKNLVGATQISSGTIGTGMFKLLTLGFDPWLVRHAWGYAPILPLHQSYQEKSVKATDVISYGGTVLPS
jgi:methenyltetrahydromethanopterin cyclohydrolase